MKRADRRKLVLAGALLTLVWLAAGTGWFVHWQASEGATAPAGRMWREAIEAALLVALIFWVIAGIAYGIIVWIVTGRGPRA
jgi:fatty acid desaturase